MSAAPALTLDDPAQMAAFLATVEDHDPVEETPTVDTHPEQDTTTTDAQDDATTTRARNERGQFVPADPAPATTTADAADTTDPATDTTPTPPARNYEQELAEAQRREQTLRAQIENAAKQAEEKGKREALAQATQTARLAIRNELQDAVNRGDLSLDAAQLRLAEKQQEWAREDLAQREQGLTQREAEAQMQALGGTVQEATSRLYHQAAPLLAQDHGLDVTEVRAYWDNAEERQRFQRAVLQTKMAQQFPNAGFNASAVEDYLNTTSTAMQQIAKAKQASAAQLAAKDAEIAALRLQLNRAEAGDNPAAQARETAGRGGAGKDDLSRFYGTNDTLGMLEAMYPRSA